MGDAVAHLGIAADDAEQRHLALQESFAGLVESLVRALTDLATWTGGHVFVANLPSAPTGKAYEMWTIGDAAPQPAGVFQVDTAGRGTHRIPPVEGGKPVKVFAVTLEPEGGVPAPTGPMVLASSK